MVELDAADAVCGHPDPRSDASRIAYDDAAADGVGDPRSH